MRIVVLPDHVAPPFAMYIVPPGQKRVAVDLGSASYIDSSGIELLFRLHAALAADGVELIVVAPDGSNAARLLGLVSMSDIGEVRRSLAEALHRCGS